MKITNDSDEVLYTGDDSDSLLVVDSEGRINAFLPNGEPDEPMPLHGLALAELMALLSEKGIEGLAKDFERRARH